MQGPDADADVVLPAPTGLQVPDARVVLPAPTGLQNYSWAPAAARPATCLYCNTAIPRATWRFDYRVKASRALGDQRRIHHACLPRCNMATRATDVALVRRWLADETKPEAEIVMLREALALLGGDAAGAAAAAAAAASGARSPAVVRPGSSHDVA